ncbi:MAG: hypothetical protein B7Z81_08645 [Acidocella sp. 20-61-6]|nr:MAG: hypothetical protein B7Z81_08645 [Acidocella sp. 20-61-6]
MLKPRSALLASVCILPSLLLCGPGGAAFAAQPARGQAAQPVPSGGVIAAIRVSGNRRIEADTISSYMVVQPGDAFDPARINESLKTLYETGLFANVSITRSGNDLDVAVVENPTVDQVLFAGNKAINDKDALAAMTLKSRSVYTVAAVEADRRALLDLYAKKGHYNATVTPNVIKLPDNRVNVVFQCNDGAETLISRITFIGNDHFSQGKLDEVVSSREDAWYRFFSSATNYSPDRIEYDQYLLQKFYEHKGYADFKVISANAALSPDRVGGHTTGEKPEREACRV